MLSTQIVDGGGDGHGLKVNKEGAMGVVVHTHPPQEELFNTLPFRQYLTDDGKASGSNDMKVDGLASPIEFCVTASPKNDIYIKSVSVVIVFSTTGHTDIKPLTIHFFCFSSHM